MQRRAMLFVGVVVMGSFGCVPLPPEDTAVSSPRKASEDFPLHLAVLPFGNRTGSSAGPVIARVFVRRHLDRVLGYLIQNTLDTDQILETRNLSARPGESLADSTSSQPPGTLASWLGVEGLVHGEVLAFQKSSVGLLTGVGVHIKIWVTDAHGEVRWEGEKDLQAGGLATGFVSLDTVLSDGTVTSEEAALIRQNDLSELALRTVEFLLADFPRR